MFNASYPTLTPGNALPTSKDAATANPISIQMARVVAKAAVFKGLNFTINGGGNAKYHFRLEKYQQTILFYTQNRRGDHQRL